MQAPRTDRILAFAALLLLVGGCLLVLWPFLTAAIWAVILASTSWPLFLRIDGWCGRRRMLSATLMTLSVTVVLLGPIALVGLMLAGNVTELVHATSAMLRDGLPDAPAWLRQLPVAGPAAHDYWQQFAHDGERLTTELARLAAPARDGALIGGRAVGSGILDLGLSVFLAFFFFVNGEVLASRLLEVLGHLVGRRAQHLLGLARATVSGVVYGILGTAMAQGALAAIGFLVAGVPGAILLGAATSVLSVVPVGPPLIWGSAAIWLFRQGQPGWALFVLAWGFFVVSTVDNIIKPFIISRGANLPFVIVLFGVFGGVLAFGLIGAFLGPTLLAVGYRLLAEWTSPVSESEGDEGLAPTGGDASVALASVRRGGEAD